MRSKSPVRFLLLLLLLFTARAEAFHIAGGDLSTRWLGGNAFELRLTLFRDCSNPNAANFDPTIIIGLYSLNGNILTDSFHVDLTAIYPLQLAGNGCVPPPAVCMEQGQYIRTVQLPPNADGYYLVWERCCRNNTITNLSQPGQTAMTFYHELPNPAIGNSSPIFNSAPLPYTCAGQYFRFDFNAGDIDGDSLVYLLSVPSDGGNTSNQDPNPFSTPSAPGGGNQVPAPAPYTSAQWANGYSLSNICGGATPLVINAATGLVEGIPASPGFYAMAVTVMEYRNGVLIGQVRREIEFTVIACNDNSSPNLSPEITGSYYELYASDTLCFTVKSVDPDGDSIYLIHRGEVFAQSPATGLPPPYASTRDTSGIDSVRTFFCWETTCAQARSTPYVIIYETTDNGCPLPLTKLDTIRILVKPVPVIDVPNLLCMQISDTAVVVYKNEQNNILPRYFRDFKLYRSVGGSPYQLIETSTDPGQFVFIDQQVSQPGLVDHCYFIVATNSCGEQSVSDTLCSLTQLNAKNNYIEYVTVTGENSIELRWSDFPDGPFSTYIIERSESDTNAYSEVVRLNGYSAYIWADNSVQTGSKSYCYRMRNIDFCGNTSANSNHACSILLSGTAGPFSNEIDWTPYSEWMGGVERYEVERRSENGLPILLGQTSASTLAYTDDQIPLNGGFSLYRVKATEGSGGKDAKSYSNEIALVQLPLLYVPNAFSPNSDTHNNGWSIFSAFVRSAEISIYNRWGQEVFSSSATDAVWDGTFEGAECPSGVYGYRIRYTGFDNARARETTGRITLIR